MALQSTCAASRADLHIDQDSNRLRPSHLWKSVQIAFALMLSAPALFPQSEPSELVSATLAGSVGNALSSSSAMSADGRYIVFRSDATDLVAPGSPTSDVYLRDMLAGTTRAVHLPDPADYVFNLALNADGTVLALELAYIQAATVSKVYVLDLTTDTATLVSRSLGGAPAAGSSRCGPLSADGRYVAFTSAASDIVAGDTNGVNDGFVFDRSTSSIERVSVATGGAESNGESSVGGIPKISGDGRFIAFYSSATNLVSADTNGVRDVFLRDRAMDVTTRVSVGHQGQQLSASTQAVWLSRDGRRIVFATAAPEVVPGDSNGAVDLFLRDLVSGNLTVLSRNAAGFPANGASKFLGASPRGSHVLLGTSSTNMALEPNASGGFYALDTSAGTMRRVVMNYRDDLAWQSTSTGSLSENGRYFAFSSSASSVFADDTNGTSDVFRRDLSIDCPVMTAQSFCAGDGSAGACPCGGTGSTGAGCAGVGGLTTSVELVSEGLASVSNDTLRLVASQPLFSGFPVTQGGLFVQGTTPANGGNGVAFGMGLRCVAGSVVRLSTTTNPTLAPTVVHGFPMHAPLSSVGIVCVGTTSYYQYVYRATPSWLGFCNDDWRNSSNGHRVVWIP